MSISVRWLPADDNSRKAFRLLCRFLVNTGQKYNYDNRRDTSWIIRVNYVTNIFVDEHTNLDPTNYEQNIVPQMHDVH